MKVIAKKLTEKCYMFNDAKTNKPISMITCDGGFRFIGKDESFKTIEALAKSIDAVIVTPEETITKVTEIDGYPIKHDEVFNIGTRGILDTSVPTYATTKDSSVRFAAGYYAIKSTDNFVSVMSPKVQTLVDSEQFFGPFKTVLEVNHQITISNRA